MCIWNFLLMLGVEPRISEVGGDHPANCFTAIASSIQSLPFSFARQYLTQIFFSITFSFSLSLPTQASKDAVTLLIAPFNLRSSVTQTLSKSLFITQSFTLKNFRFHGLWKWSSGQRACLTIWRSEFESRWTFYIFCKLFFEIRKINKKMSTLAHFSKNICFFSC